MLVTRFMLALVAATVAGLLIHVAYGQGWANEFVQSAAEGGRLENLLQPPYPPWYLIVAWLSALLPTAAKVLGYLLIGPRLPGRGWRRGLLYGLLLLAMSDAAVRLPLMNGLAGNPIDVVLVQGLEAWLIYPVMGTLIGLLLPLQVRRTG